MVIVFLFPKLGLKEVPKHSSEFESFMLEIRFISGWMWILKD